MAINYNPIDYKETTSAYRGFDLVNDALKETSNNINTSLSWLNDYYKLKSEEINTDLTNRQTQAFKNAVASAQSPEELASILSQPLGSAINLQAIGTAVKDQYAFLEEKYKGREELKIKRSEAAAKNAASYAQAKMYKAQAKSYEFDSQAKYIKNLSDKINLTKQVQERVISELDAGNDKPEIVDLNLAYNGVKSTVQALVSKHYNVATSYGLSPLGETSLASEYQLKNIAKNTLKSLNPSLSEKELEAQANEIVDEVYSESGSANRDKFYGEVLIDSILKRTNSSIAKRVDRVKDRNYDDMLSNAGISFRIGDNQYTREEPENTTKSTPKSKPVKLSKESIRQGSTTPEDTKKIAPARVPEVATTTPSVKVPSEEPKKEEPKEEEIQEEEDQTQEDTTEEEDTEDTKDTSKDSSPSGSDSTASKPKDIPTSKPEVKEESSPKSDDSINSSEEEEEEQEETKEEEDSNTSESNEPESGSDVSTKEEKKDEEESTTLTPEEKQDILNKVEKVEKFPDSVPTPTEQDDVDKLNRNDPDEIAKDSQEEIDKQIEQFDKSNPTPESKETSSQNEPEENNTSPNEAPKENSEQDTSKEEQAENSTKSEEPIEEGEDTRTLEEDFANGLNYLDELLPHEKEEDDTYKELGEYSISSDEDVPYTLMDSTWKFTVTLNKSNDFEEQLQAFSNTDIEQDPTNGGSTNPVYSTKKFKEFVALWLFPDSDTITDEMLELVPTDWEFRNYFRKKLKSENTGEDPYFDYRSLYPSVLDMQDSYKSDSDSYADQILDSPEEMFIAKDSNEKEEKRKEAELLAKKAEEERLKKLAEEEEAKKEAENKARIAFRKAAEEKVLLVNKLLEGYISAGRLLTFDDYAAIDLLQNSERLTDYLVDKSLDTFIPFNDIDSVDKLTPEHIKLIYPKLADNPKLLEDIGRYIAKKAASKSEYENYSINLNGIVKKRADIVMLSPEYWRVGEFSEKFNQEANNGVKLGTMPDGLYSNELSAGVAKASGYTIRKGFDMHNYVRTAYSIPFSKFPELGKKYNELYNFNYTYDNKEKNAEAFDKFKDMQYRYIEFTNTERIKDINKIPEVTYGPGKTALPVRKGATLVGVLKDLRSNAYSLNHDPKTQKRERELESNFNLALSVLLPEKDYDKFQKAVSKKNIEDGDDGPLPKLDNFTFLSAIAIKAFIQGDSFETTVADLEFNYNLKGEKAQFIAQNAKNFLNHPKMQRLFNVTKETASFVSEENLKDAKLKARLAFNEYSKNGFINYNDWNKGKLPESFKYLSDISDSLRRGDYDNISNETLTRLTQGINSNDITVVQETMQQLYQLDNFIRLNFLSGYGVKSEERNNPEYQKLIQIIRDPIQALLRVGMERMRDLDTDSDNTLNVASSEYTVSSGNAEFDSKALNIWHSPGELISARDQLFDRNNFSVDLTNILQGESKNYEPALVFKSNLFTDSEGKPKTLTVTLSDIKREIGKYQDFKVPGFNSLALQSVINDTQNWSKWSLNQKRKYLQNIFMKDTDKGPTRVNTAMRLMLNLQNFNQQLTLPGGIQGYDSNLGASNSIAKLPDRADSYNHTKTIGIYLSGSINSTADIKNPYAKPSQHDKGWSNPRAYDQGLAAAGFTFKSFTTDKFNLGTTNTFTYTNDRGEEALVLQPIYHEVEKRKNIATIKFGQVFQNNGNPTVLLNDSDKYGNFDITNYQALRYLNTKEYKFSNQDEFKYSSVITLPVQNTVENFYFNSKKYDKIVEDEAIKPFTNEDLSYIVKYGIQINPNAGTGNKLISALVDPNAKSVPEIIYKIADFADKVANSPVVNKQPTKVHEITSILLINNPHFLHEKFTQKDVNKLIKQHKLNNSEQQRIKSFNPKDLDPIVQNYAKQVTAYNVLKTGRVEANIILNNPTYPTYFGALQNGNPEGVPSTEYSLSTMNLMANDYLQYLFGEQYFGEEAKNLFIHKPKPTPGHVRKEKTIEYRKNKK